MREFAMKKMLLTVIAVFSALFPGACSDWLNDGGEMTDVEYTVSPDGKAGVTLYFDEGVPVTKQQRAMSTKLAKKYYDYFEVVFDAGPNGLARASWELGEPAGISGVYRPTDVNYRFRNGPAIYGTEDYNPGTSNGALIFVGTTDRTLLGVGRIIKVDDGAYIPVGAAVNIGPATKSVTFEVEAIKTGLCIQSEVSEYTGEVLSTSLCPFASFRWADDPSTKNRPPSSNRVSLGGKNYPYYDSSINRNLYYIFYGPTGFHNDSLGRGIRYRSASTPPNDVVYRKTPRYVHNGQYFELNSIYSASYASSTIKLGSASPNEFNSFTAGKPVANMANEFMLHLNYTTSNNFGILSFCIDIPVYLMNDAPAKNGGPAAQTWYLRSGIGPDLYCLDDGLGSGGCVLMGYGVGTPNDTFFIPET
jgi:hypothetical protein